MRKIFIITGLLLITFSFARAQKGDEDASMLNNVKLRDQKAIDEAVNGWWTASMKTHEERVAWWREARFGMFVHWGVYSLPGGEWKGKKVSGYAEHLMRKERIPRSEYLELAHKFNPVKFNADEWISNAKKAGMRYFIITAKHHDGFAMFDSKASDYNIVKQTPFKRDPMAELSVACKKYGIKFGFYYSHAFDWEDPNAPGNDWDYDNPGGDSLLHGGANWFDVHPELLPKVVKYINEKAIPQIKELLTKYHPDILWFDTPHKIPLSENIRILKVIRETDPNVIVNGRLARSSNFMFGDYQNTSDRPAEFFPVKGDWEGIPTTNESYGYSKFDLSHKPVSYFIQLLAKAASRGGNILMNIGPMGDGEMAPKDLEILKGIGIWMDKNHESIYGTIRSPLAIQNWGVSTLKDKKLFLHVFNFPENGNLFIGGLKSNVKNAYLLADPSKKPLKFNRINPLDVALTLPSTAKDAVNTVVVLETEGKIVTDTARLLSYSFSNTLLAFDAQLQGKGFKFGDGKTDRYYVEGWKQKEQNIGWQIRLNAPGAYKVSVKYLGSTDSEGAFNFLSDNKIVKEDKIIALKKGTQVISLDLGTLNLAKGVHDLKLVPVEIKKAELMKLLEIQLTPVKQ
jgi:alpha-L-fucosidase